MRSLANPAGILVTLAFAAVGCESLRTGPTTEGIDGGTLDAQTDGDSPRADAAGDASSHAAADAIADSGPVADARDPNAKRRVFVTSATFSPVFADPNDRSIAVVLGRADALCTAAALKAGIGGSYRAWIGGSYAGTYITTDQHAQAIHGPYEDLLGNEIFTKTTVTGTSNILTPSVTELGTRVTAAERAWTGEDSLDQCDRSVDNSPMAWAGTTNNGQCGNPTNASYWYTGFSVPCTEMAHLYCFEQ